MRPQVRTVASRNRTTPSKKEADLRSNNVSSDKKPAKKRKKEEEANY